MLYFAFLLAGLGASAAELPKNLVLADLGLHVIGVGFQRTVMPKLAAQVDVESYTPWTQNINLLGLSGTEAMGDTAGWLLRARPFPHAGWERRIRILTRGGCASPWPKREPRLPSAAQEGIMSTHSARVEWSRTTPDFLYDTYDRGHTVSFGSGASVPASSAVEFKGDPSRVNPEESFVGALSSCHMLTFLAIAARKGLVVDSYTDNAEGYLEKEGGKLWMTRVVLRPNVRFAGETPAPEVIARIHEQAHAGCFIASSVRSAVSVEPSAG